jgi:hypothetical protein
MYGGGGEVDAGYGGGYPDQVGYCQSIYIYYCRLRSWSLPIFMVAWQDKNRS